MTLSPMRRIAVVAALITAVGQPAMAAAASGTQAAQPQQRQLATTTLSDFKVVLTATCDPGHPLLATVTAASYRRSDSGWKLIATKQTGTASGWFWFSVQTCSLTTTQLSNNTVSASPPVLTSDLIKVSLLISPALGCSRTFSAHWTP
jgi:hypothetical protein